MGSTAPEQSVILYFGDQTEKNIPFEELFEYSRKSERTSKFLQNAFQSIQLVIETLREPERSKYKFESFEEISKQLAAESSPDVVLRTIILCAAQLGYLIAYVRYFFVNDFIRLIVFEVFWRKIRVCVKHGLLKRR